MLSHTPGTEMAVMVGVLGSVVRDTSLWVSRQHNSGSEATPFAENGSAFAKAYLNPLN